MDLVDVNVVGSKPTQGVVDLLQDARAAGVADHPSTFPFKAGLGGDKHARAQPTLGECLPNDFLGATESVSRRRVDDIDAMLDAGSDRGNRFRLIGSTPHPAADRPGADSDAR